MLKNNYHTHMKYCNHAKGMVIDYVRMASSLNMEELGMTDHAPVLDDFLSSLDYDRNYGSDNMKLEQVDDYLNQIEECRMLYPNLKIYSGFESEFLEDHEDFYRFLRNKVDYMNLGIHFFKYNGKVINTYEDMTEDTLKGYVKNVENALKSGIFNTLCHPDLFMFDYKDKFGNHEFDDACRLATHEICKLAIKYDVYLEVNCNGFRYVKDYNNKKEWKYPYPDFWLIAKEYPVKIILGCDAHEPEALCNQNVDLAIKFTRDLGLNVLERMVIKDGNKD